MSHELLKRAVAEWRREADLRAEAASRVEFVERGDQISVTPKAKSASREHHAAKPQFAPNLALKALDDLSYLYSVPPIRTGDASTDEWGAFWKRNRMLMIQADRSIRLCGTVLAVASKNSRGEAFVDLVSRDRFAVVRDDEFPGEVQAALYLHSTKMLGSQVVKIFRYVDAENSAMIENAPGANIGQVVFEPHSLGACPATTLKNSPSINGLFGSPLGGIDFLANLKTINQFFLELGWTAYLQRGQFVRKNAARETEGKQIVLAPDFIIDIDEMGDFFSVNGGANLEGMAMVFQLMLDAFARSIHLPRDSFAIKTVQPSSSAEVIRASDNELQRDRLLRSQLAMEWEQEIARICNLVDSRLGKNVEVEFATAPKPLTHAEKMAETKFVAEQGLEPRRTLLRDLKPHLSLAEVDERVTEAEKEAEKQAMVQRIIAGREDNGSGQSEPDEPNE